jgi:hypothetical protein
VNVNNIIGGGNVGQYHIKRLGNGGKAHIWDKDINWLMCCCGKPTRWLRQNKTEFDNPGDMLRQFQKISIAHRCKNCEQALKDEIVLRESWFSEVEKLI